MKKYIVSFHVECSELSEMAQPEILQYLLTGNIIRFYTIEPDYRDNYYVGGGANK